MLSLKEEVLKFCCKRRKQPWIAHRARLMRKSWLGHQPSSECHRLG